MILARKKERQRDAKVLLSQIAGMTDSELTPVQEDSRQHVRKSRVFPVLLTPWEDGGPTVADSVYALTKDVSGQGLALVLQSPYRIEQAVIGLVIPSPGDPNACCKLHFVLGTVRQNVPLGGGYWQLGFELNELLQMDDHPSLEQLSLPARVVSKVTCANLLKKGNMH